MPKLVTVEAIHRQDPDRLFSGALDFAEVEEAMAGFATYEGVPQEEVFIGQTFDVRVTFWGWYKNPPHTIYVEQLDRQNRLIQSREHCKRNGINRWDHKLQIFPDAQGARWRDEITIDAGYRTFAVAHFARYVYSRRHKSRQALSINTSIKNLAHP